MTVLYTPLDIEVEPFESHAVIDWFDANKIDEPDYWVFKEGRHEWALAGASQPVNDWTKIKPYEDWLAQKFEPSTDAELHFAPGFESALPQIVAAIRQMPFKEIGAVGLLKQLIEIDPHTDTHDPSNPTEPSRIMMFLTEPSENTFYMLDQDQVKLAHIHPEYRAFAFNNNAAKHGALPPKDVKILLSVVGILDHAQHQELIERSVAKFADLVISAL
jgi:hypothetical protein